MKQEYIFEDQHQFLEKLEHLVKGGIEPAQMQVITPYPVHGVEEILQIKASPLRFFTLLGALCGLIFGFLFTIFTALDWPLIGGGKPIVSLPAFVIVAFELTILFGGVISFVAFLFLSGLPSVRNIISTAEYGNKFVIQIGNEAKND